LSMNQHQICGEITGLWREIGAFGLIEFLSESDFYTAPCSTRHHLAVEGGLAEHSLNVFNLLDEKCERYHTLLGRFPRRSIIVCGLGHDLCKVNYYREGGPPCSDAQYSYLHSLWERNRHWAISQANESLRRLLSESHDLLRTVPATHASVLINWLKDRSGESCPQLPATWAVNDQLPLGHGEKSLSILQDHIRLTVEEKLAIRWHMAAWDLSDYSGKWAYNTAAKMTPLVALLAAADFEASAIIEREAES
jgi:hypothetical protein